MIAISFGAVFYKVFKKKLSWVIALPFILNLIFNFIFTPIQFGLRNNLLAALDILLVLATLIWAMVIIYPRVKWIAYLQIPYLFWVIFATILQLTVTYLNLNPRLPIETVPLALISPSPAVGLANPAAVYCREQGGQSQIATAADGSQSADCIFPDGSKCDEWAFFRNECQRGIKSNFSAEGNYLVIEGRPVFLYDEPGNPSASLDLRFSAESVCDFGQGEGKCNVHELNHGDRVSINGIKTKNELTIILMKKIAE